MMSVSASSASSSSLSALFAGGSAEGKTGSKLISWRFSAVVPSRLKVVPASVLLEYQEYIGKPGEWKMMV